MKILVRMAAALGMVALLGAVLPVSAQEWKGKGRLEGKVTDLEGKPIAGATVKLRTGSSPGSGPDLKSDGGGRWTVLGLRGGEWKITIEAPGFIAGDVLIQVSEVTRANPIVYKMPPVQVAAPGEAQTTGLPPEIVEAVKAGNEALEQKKWTDARIAFEKALPAIPDNVGLLMALARSYSGEGNTDKAIETLKKVTEKEPKNNGVWLLIANMLLEKGRLEEGRAALDKVPVETITDPNVFINIGVLYMNQKKNEEAEKSFTRAVDVAPGQFDGYYYRGLSRVAQQKRAEAKGDLAKVVELAPPDSTEAKEARQLLEALK